MILIELNGERQLVESLDGYKGCSIIEKNVDHPPHEHCYRSEGRWIEDLEAKDQAAEHARLHAMSRGELVEHILRRVRA